MKLNAKKGIQYFVVGSLIVILVCMSVTAVIFSYSFLQKEEQRAEISREQLEHFFEFHYAPMSEEMWSGSVESIGKRVSIIAKQMGAKHYTLLIADKKGACVFAKQGDESIPCRLPERFRSLISERLQTLNKDPILQFEEGEKRYVYAVPLVVGDTRTGFLYVALPDSYDFYRGSFYSISFTVFLPAMAIILMVWFIWLLWSRKEFLNPYLEYLQEVKADEVFADRARKTAHDMKDPLSGLVRAIKRQKIQAQDQNHILSFLFQLQDVADGLLNQSRIRSAESNPSPQLLCPILEQVVARKRVQFSGRANVELTFLNDEGSGWGFFADIVRTDLVSGLSNLINNAVESIGGKGVVTISLGDTESFYVIEIKDTGCGIPRNVLPKIGKKGFSYGKSGNGYGLYFAKLMMESWGGQLELDSCEGVGTSIRLLFPKVEAPAWFPARLNLYKDAKIVILDDQDSIHDRWAERLKSFEWKGDIEHFKTASDFLIWHRNQQFKGPILYLMDLDLNGERITGLDIIDDLELFEKAVLVTSHSDESLKKTCEKIGLKLLPKALIEIVPINVVSRSESEGVA